ncbi:disease resistance RPP13-like protein 4 [Camellia sinensis]|uniref:disease resistance RPP13-like protein 4 n=1 Tax=Camellia sinensis TaxID=4442 RepID=UPI001035D50F|nr:disease resistance RPP13-like protein 4 [Camellia sinensis]
MVAAVSNEESKDCNDGEGYLNLKLLSLTYSLVCAMVDKMQRRRKKVEKEKQRKNKAIEMASSLSDIPSSSTTSCEIVPIEEDKNHSFSSNNPTQIAMSDYNTNNKVIKKSPSGVVVDHPEAKSESLTVNFLRTFLFGHNKNSKSKSIHNKPTANSQTRSSNSNSNSNEPRSNDDDNRSRSVVEALSKLIGADLDYLDKTLNRMRKYEDQIKAASESLKKLKEAGGSEENFRELKRIVMKLKEQIFSMRENEPEGSLETLKNQDFGQTLDSKEFWGRYGELDAASKVCLLCFSVFPENAEIKKRVMIYWWIGEGFVTTEQSANELFHKLIVKGLIEPVCKNHSGGVVICKMDPLVRSLVINIAQTFNFVDVDDASATPRDLACLTGKRLAKIQQSEKLALFNVNEDILEFNPTWFSKMQNASVLYLGRWQTSPSHHIEVEDTTAMKTKNANVLDGLENLTHLRFLSLQGISRITELSKSISKLRNLTILDIRACHNLEVIPDGIGLLKNLTHLDMSECYLLDQMPKALALLSKLQVLKGFLVSEGINSCTLDDLQKIPRLRKLSIYAVVHGFPSDRDLCVLNQFKALTQLTIVWASRSVQPTVAPTRSVTSKPAELAMLSLGLIKLDVRCFPWMTTPIWLRACNLKNLKKLYIRGGQLSDLGQKLDDKKAEKDKWEVEVLCLKYLDDLEMGWSDLQELFPKLKFLEMSYKMK